MNDPDKFTNNSEKYGVLFYEAKQVIQCLLDHGYDAYMVGGCVRDFLLGWPVYDIDIATSARPEQVATLFPKVIPTGLQHGTVTVVMTAHTYEVTTFRKELLYDEHRRPREVTFIKDLVEDLRRRDFTINAMAQNIYGHIVDPFGGQADLKRRLIRCVGVAEERFREDALRMMRGVRFASLLEGVFVKSTWRALLRNKEILSFVAMERVRDELWKLTLGHHPARGWKLLVRSRLLVHVKEPLGVLASSMEANRWQPLLNALEQVDTVERRVALLLLGHGVDKVEARRILRTLRCSGLQQKAILGILQADALLTAGGAAALNSVVVGTHTAAAWRHPFAQTLLIVGEQSLRDVLVCQRALHAEEVDQCAAAMKPFLRYGEAWLEHITVRSLQDIALKGTDLLQITTRSAGPWLRQCLEAIWIAVALGDINNERTALLKYVREVWNE